MTVGGMPVLATARRFYHEFQQDELMVRAGDLAFRFFLALFPLMLVLATGGGLVAEMFYVNDPTDRVMERFGDALPEDAASVVRGQVDGVVSGANAGLFSIGLIAALWAGSSGTDRSSRPPTRPMAPPRAAHSGCQKLLALGVTVVGGILLIALVVGLVIAQVYAEDIASRFGVGAQFNLVVGLVQEPVVILVVLVAIALLYWLAPSVRVPFHCLARSRHVHPALGAVHRRVRLLRRQLRLLQRDLWHPGRRSHPHVLVLLLQRAPARWFRTQRRPHRRTRPASAPEPGFLADRRPAEMEEEPGSGRGGPAPANAGRAARPGVLGLAGLFLAAFAIKQFDR